MGAAQRLVRTLGKSMFFMDGLNLVVGFFSDRSAVHPAQIWHDSAWEGMRLTE